MLSLFFIGGEVALPITGRHTPIAVIESQERAMITRILEDIHVSPPIEKENTKLPAIAAKAYLVGDVTSGMILSGKNKNERLPIASITKLMTAVVAIEHYSLDETVKIPRTAAQVLGAKVGLFPNEDVSVRDLLNSALIRSGNDAAEALALHAPGGKEQFLGWMNEKAALLKLNDTHFVNAVGFDANDHYSSAQDLFQLSRYLLETHPLLREAVGKTSYEFTSKSGRFHKVETTNKLFGGFLNIKGMKTGTTEDAGASFVGLAEGDKGQQLISVVLNSPDRFQESKILLWWGLENWIWQ